MDEVGEVAAVVEDHVERLAIGEEDGLLNAPHVPARRGRENKEVSAGTAFLLSNDVGRLTPRPSRPSRRTPARRSRQWQPRPRPEREGK